MKRILILLLLSIAVATALFYVNSDVVQSDLQGKIGEITVITIPVFIIISLIYYVNRAIIKKVKSGAVKKKPSA